jgi:hypothetical protein
VKRTLTFALVAVAVFGLAACEKPNPGATVWSGTNSEHSQALCWSTDPAVAGTRDCAQDVIAKFVAGGKAPVITVTPGNTLGISVDPEVADNGWFPVIGQERLSQTPITSTYFRFTFPTLQQIPADGHTADCRSRQQTGYHPRALDLQAAARGQLNRAELSPGRLFRAGQVAGVEDPVGVPLLG